MTVVHTNSLKLTFEDGRICAIREPRKHQTGAETLIQKNNTYKLSTFLAYALLFLQSLRPFSEHVCFLTKLSDFRKHVAIFLNNTWFS